MTEKEAEHLIFSKTAELKTKYLRQGPLVYELYGIMLHSGGAYGGHYSAYIKDFEADSEDAWFHFNDSFVRKISVTEIVAAFGQNKNKRIASNLQNAYMLMYRLLSSDQRSSIPIDEISEEIQQEVAHWT